MIIYFSVMSLVTFILFGADKRKAEKKKYRISEKTLLGFSLAGGAFGGLVAMTVFRHKTCKLKFLTGVPVMAAVHAGILIYYVSAGGKNGLIWI